MDDLSFSRSSHDKLITAVTVKFAPEDVDSMDAISESMGMDRSEYIRHLVSTDRERARQKWEALNRIFAQQQAQAKDYEG